jgi:hypothetical protein
MRALPPSKADKGVPRPRLRVNPGRTEATVLAVSEPIAPGEVAVIFALVPSADASLDHRPIAVWRDPPTAAAFDLQRIDVLTIGETLDETGHLASSVRLVVRNRSAEPAQFRAPTCSEWSARSGTSSRTRGVADVTLASPLRARSRRAA